MKMSKDDQILESEAERKRLFNLNVAARKRIEELERITSHILYGYDLLRFKLIRYADEPGRKNIAWELEEIIDAHEDEICRDYYEYRKALQEAKTRRQEARTKRWVSRPIQVTKGEQNA